MARWHPSWGRLNSNQPHPPKYPQTDQRILLPTKYDWLVDGPFWTITAVLLWQVIFYPLRDVVWLEPPAFQEELVKPPTFHNFADPILHNIVIKDIFAWFISLVQSKLQTGRVWKLLKLATTVQKWIEINIPAIVCSILRQTVGRRKRYRKRFCVQGGTPHSSLWDTLRDALLSLACTLGEALKTNEKVSYMEISDVGIPDTPQSKKNRKFLITPSLGTS